MEPDSEIDIAGAFTHFDNVSAPYITRLFGLNNAGSGTIQFDAPTYSVVEDVTNVVIGVERDGGTAGTATVLFTTSNGTAAAGTNYIGVTSTLTFPKRGNI